MENISLSSYSFFTSFGGYGICNIGAAKYLKRLGVNVSCSKDFAPHPSSREFAILDDEEKKLFTEQFEVHKMGVSGTTPWEFSKNRSEIKVAMTMAESNQLGKSWIDACNGMHHIFVPNAWNRDVFVSSGVTTPVSVSRSGIDGEKWSFIDRPERSVFTFGICGYLNDRKGVYEVIRAFASEFSRHEPVRLLLHSTNPFFRYYGKYKDPRISLSSHYMSFEELKKFYASLDCFVFPSKAEGIGYPPREAMATGLPVILTKYSGLDEIADRRYSYPLKPIRFIKRTDMLEQPGEWAEIDIAELMFKMRTVFRYQNAAKKKGKRAAEHMSLHHTWAKCAPRLKVQLEEVYATLAG